MDGNYPELYGQCAQPGCEHREWRPDDERWTAYCPKHGLYQLDRLEGPQLWGPAEILAWSGVTRPAYLKWTRREDFPLPIVVLRQGPVWDAVAVRQWRRAFLAGEFKPKRGAEAFMAEPVDFGGETVPRGEAIQQMQEDGIPQAGIDRWLQAAALTKASRE